MKTLQILAILLLVAMAASKRIKTTDLNSWGKINCKLATVQENTEEGQEKRWFASTIGTTCKGYKQKVCAENRGCEWSKEYDSCMSYCYGCYYITDQKNSNYLELPNRAETNWPAGKKLYIAHENYVTGGRLLLTKQQCTNPN